MAEDMNRTDNLARAELIKQAYRSQLGREADPAAIEAGVNDLARRGLSGADAIGHLQKVLGGSQERQQFLAKQASTNEQAALSAGQSRLTSTLSGIRDRYNSQDADLARAAGLARGADISGESKSVQDAYNSLHGSVDSQSDLYNQDLEKQYFGTNKGTAVAGLDSSETALGRTKALLAARGMGDSGLLADQATKLGTDMTHAGLAHTNDLIQTLLGQKRAQASTDRGIDINQATKAIQDQTGLDLQSAERMVHMQLDAEAKDADQLKSDDFNKAQPGENIFTKYVLPTVLSFATGGASALGGAAAGAIFGGGKKSPGITPPNGENGGGTDPTGYSGSYMNGVDAWRNGIPNTQRRPQFRGMTMRGNYSGTTGQSENYDTNYGMGNA